jgi:hypothetical protein
MWDMHFPQHKPDEQCKAVVYTRKALLHSYTIQNNITHPLSNPNSVVIDILKSDELLAQLINIYNPPNPKPLHPTHPPLDFCRTTLKYLTDHDLDEKHPTVITRDFNTHAEHWSLPRTTFSSWATCLCDWFDDHGFSLLNPPLTPTWRPSREGEKESIIDLVLANEVALWMGHVGPVEISEAESLGSDHAALLFSVLPSDHPSHIPSPSPAGYRAEDKQRQAWIKMFSSTLPYDMILSSHTNLDRERMIEGLTDPACVHMTQLNSFTLSGEVGPAGDPEDIPNRAQPSEMCEARLMRCLQAFDHAIDTTNQKNLKPK